MHLKIKFLNMYINQEPKINKSVHARKTSIYIYLNITEQNKNKKKNESIPVKVDIDRQLSADFWSYEIA